MITREELKRMSEQITRESEKMNNDIEEALALTDSKELKHILENLQDNVGCYACACSMYHWGISFTNIISDCLDKIEYLEKVVAKTPKLQSYIEAFEQISDDVKEWSKILK